MNLQDFLAALDVRHGDHHLAVKPAGPQKGRIQNIWPVGGGNQNNPFVGFKPVHFHQKLVEGLLPFIMSAAQTGAPMPPHGVNFIDKDDAGGILFALDKQVPDPGGAHADKHFHKIGTADAEKRHPGFTGNGPGQQGFAGSRGAHQQDPFGDAAAQAGEFFGISQKLDDFAQFLFGFVDTGNIFKGNFFRLIGQQPGPAFSKRHGLAPAGLHLAHEKYPHADQHDHGKP